MTLDEWLTAAPIWVPERVKEGLRELATKSPRPTMERGLLLAETTCEAHGLTFDTVLVDDRRPSVNKVRCECYRVLRGNGYGLQQIGRIMNRHHTSVMNGLKPKGEPRKVDPERALRFGKVAA